MRGAVQVTSSLCVMENAVMVSVESMVGNIVWGPALADAMAPLSLLQGLVAEKMGVLLPAVHLVHEARMLHGTLAEEAVPDGAVIKCVLDAVKGSIESSMMKVRATLEAHNGNSWNLQTLLGEAPVPNEEHCPKLGDLDWSCLDYKELTLVEEVEEVNNHAGRFQKINQEFYFGSVDPHGIPSGYGFVLKQFTCSGECDYRSAYHGLFLPVEGYKMPMSSLTNSMLVQGFYHVSNYGDHNFETWFTEKNGLFDGTEAQEE